MKHQYRDDKKLKLLKIIFKNTYQTKKQYKYFINNVLNNYK